MHHLNPGNITLGVEVEDYEIRVGGKVLQTMFFSLKAHHLTTYAMKLLINHLLVRMIRGGEIYFFIAEHSALYLPLT